MNGKKKKEEKKKKRKKKEKKKKDKAVYTTTPVAGSWAGAAMIWARACSNTNFPTLKKAKNAKKAKCDGRTQCVTDRPTR